MSTASYLTYATNSHKDTTSEHLKDLKVRSQLPLCLVLDLPTHKRKLFMDLMFLQIPPDLDIFYACFVDFTLPDQLTRRIGHKRLQANEHDNTPGNLDTKGKSPLYWSVGGKAACKPNPVRHHGSERDTASRDTADKSSMARSGYFAEINGYGCDHSSSKILILARNFRKDVAVMGTHPTAYPAKTRPARNIPIFTEAVWMTVPIVTIIHINCMKRIRPSRSPMNVCVRAPTASPAM